MQIFVGVVGGCCCLSFIYGYGGIDGGQNGAVFSCPEQLQKSSCWSVGQSSNGRSVGHVCEK